MPSIASSYYWQRFCHSGKRGPGNETLKKRKEQTAFYNWFRPAAGPGNYNFKTQGQSLFNNGETRLYLILCIVRCCGFLWLLPSQRELNNTMQLLGGWKTFFAAPSQEEISLSDSLPSWLSTTNQKCSSLTCPDLDLENPIIRLDPLMSPWVYSWQWMYSRVST